MIPQIIPIENKFSNEVVDLILNIQQKEFNVAITIEDQPDLLNIKNFYYTSGVHFWVAFVNYELV